MKTKNEPLKSAVSTAQELKDKAPKLFGIPTGIEGLDDLFFYAEIVDGKAIKKPLGGIPYLSVVNITGVSDTGKSLMAEQFTLTQASKGYRVLFVTVESPSHFVVASLKARATALNLNWEDFEDNIVMLDVAMHSSLRDNLDSLITTMDYAIDNYETKSVVIDSITGLFEAKEMLARSIVRKLFNFIKIKRQTAIFISQKRSSHEELSAEAAGGYAVSHIVDCSIVVSKQLIMSKILAKQYNLPIGSILRLIRIDGCRLCGHDTRTHILNISDTGIVSVGKALDELIKENTK